MRNIYLFILIIICIAFSACNCLQYQLIAKRVKSPSNILLLFSTETCQGEPIAGLQAQDFIITEDGSEISLYESKQTILTKSIGFELYSVLMLDISASITDSGNIPELQKAARVFIDRIIPEQKVAILLFDGREEPQKLVPFTSDKAILYNGIDSLSDYIPVDPSTNLNGAILKGLKMLDDKENQSKAPITASILVVFTDGTDQAGRVTADKTLKAVEETNHMIFTIGLSGEVDQSYLRKIGKDGSEYASSSEDIVNAFERISQRIVRMSQRFYILAYCSPKRAGDHNLTLQVKGYRGELNIPFSAKGFRAGCDPVKLSNSSQ